MSSSISPHAGLLTNEAIERIDEQMASGLSSAVASGLIIGIVDRDGNRLVRGYGERASGSGKPVDAQTCFEIGSIGKSFTAIVFMQLAAEGKVDLQAPVTTYLPWFSIQSAFRPITLHDLLTHTSGLPGGDDPVPDARLEVWLLRDAATYDAPGEHFLYSNVGYKILGLVLESVLNQPYADIVRERLFEPLGMTGAHGAITSAMRPLMAQGQASQFDDRPRLKRHGIVPATWLETDTGDGCLAMTGDHLLTYAAILLQVASGTDSPSLTVGQLGTMRDPHVGYTPPDATYGYALGSEMAADGSERFGHSGGMVGYLSELIVDVDHGIGVVLMANGESDTSRLARFVLESAIAAKDGGDYPLVVPAPDPFDLGGQADLAGSWISRQRSIVVNPDGEHGLVLEDSNLRIPLQMSVGLRGRDQVIVDHLAWEPFPLTLEREPAPDASDEDGVRPLVKLHWGGETFYRPGTTPSTTPSYPPEWDALVGHYRSFNPWRSNFRIAIREGSLMMVGPYGHASKLMPDGDRYWIEDTPRPASEWLRFDAVVDGRALMTRSNLGEVFSRFFTP